MAKADARNLQFGPKHDVAQFVFTPKTQLAQADLTQAMMGTKTVPQFMEDYLKTTNVENVQNTKRWIVKHFAINANATNVPICFKNLEKQKKLSEALKKLQNKA
jgi:hypothetical protein